MKRGSAVNSSINNDIDLFHSLEHKLQLGLKTWGGGGGGEEAQEGEMETGEGTAPRGRD